MKKRLLFAAILMVMAGLQVASAQNASQFAVTFNGANEIPANASTNSGYGAFNLQGNVLTYSFALDYGFLPMQGGIFAPPPSGLRTPRLIHAVGMPWEAQPPPPPGHLISIDDSAPGVFYRGRVYLNPLEIQQLQSGELYVNFPSRRYPGGEIRGQIRPVTQFIATFTGASELPPTASTNYGTGNLTLLGNVLNFDLDFSDSTFWVNGFGIFGPATSYQNSFNAIFYPSIPDDLVGFPMSFYSHGDNVTLTDSEVGQLNGGLLYFNFFTVQYPQGELRGQILPGDGSSGGTIVIY